MELILAQTAPLPTSLHGCAKISYCYMPSAFPFLTPLLLSLHLTSTSKEAWDKLTRLYASRSRSRVMSLKERLIHPRDSYSLSEYLCSIKTTADELALIDTHVSDDDITIAILNGVGHDFKELTAGIRARDHLISYEELYDKLIDYEAYLK